MLFVTTLSKLPYDMRLISHPSQLTVETLAELKPEMIFFIDWSWIVAPEITSSFFCVGFHSAPLPHFRGGSPIQNQIIRGVTSTKLTAFVMDDGIDTGDILLQRDLSLDGHLLEIFGRISQLVGEMIPRIISGAYARTKQIGEGSYFPRRKPSESVLSHQDVQAPLTYIYDMIRMLEDPYPNARLQLGDKEIIFKSAEMQQNGEVIRVIADITMLKKAQ